MALIPSIRGVIVSIKAINQHYYKTEVELKDCSGFTWDEKNDDYPGVPETIKLQIPAPIEQVPFQVGDNIRAVAFPLGQSGYWEAEGISKLR